MIFVRTLEYDDVANDQRRAIYTQRNELLDVADVSETIDSIRQDVFTSMIDNYIPSITGRNVGYRSFRACLQKDFDLNLPIKEWLDKEPELHEETLRERILENLSKSIKRKKRSLC